MNKNDFDWGAEMSDKIHWEGMEDAGIEGMMEWEVKSKTWIRV